MPRQTKKQISDEVRHEREIQDLNGQIKALQRKYDVVNKELTIANRRNSFLDGMSKNFIADKLKTIKPTGESTGVLIWSDWHCEEHVDPSVVNNLNSFNLDVFTKRTDTMFERSLLCLDVARKFAKIDTLVVALLGDFISGYIHPELEEGNFLSPIQAAELAGSRIYTGLTHLSKEGGFKNIIALTCFGNHGRVQQKKRCATGYANSHEWGMYRTLEKYAKIPKVTWKVENGYHNWLDIYGYNVRFHHGDNIHYLGGVGGITIPVNKAISQWNKVRVADYDYFGHYHSFMNLPRWCCNGSVIGYGPYSLSIKAEFEVPSQTFSIISQKRGKILTDRIFCD